MEKSLYMNEALKEAYKAYNKGETPIGAIIVKDGKATMYISTKEMSFGTIKASLQEFYIGSEQEDYKNHSATIIEKDTQGNPTLWSFELPHEDGDL